ncbi:MAG: GH92 family glycosyl hydrolase [Paludibacter sp.]|nr:GH92 family glycosyl hydrolase [Paludibacter sp.]
MKKIFLLIITTCSVIMNVSAQSSLTNYVKPIVGTKSMGHTFPGACAPFGLVQLSPDTEIIPQNIDGVYQKDVYKYCAGYQYDDQTIVGFSHTHLNGTGHSDLGDILIMPTTGELKLDPGTAEHPETGYRSHFSHKREISEAGYYSVMLDDYNIKAEMTATERIGVHKYTFPAGEAHLIIDLIQGIYNYDGKVLWANLRVENDTLLTGYRITRGWARTNYTYFAISFSKPIKDYGCRNDEKVKYNGFWRKFNLDRNFPEMGGKKLTAYFNFDFKAGETLTVKVALSPVDCVGALANLRVEASGKSFDEIKTQTHQKWEKELSVITAKGNYDALCVLYTSLYHTMINPSVYMDVDGRYRGIDHNIHQANGFTNYTVFSVWDTYRAFHPLMNIINRKRNTDFVKSMLAHWEQSVHHALPVWSLMGNENWCMIGYHSVSVLSDAAAKGLDFNKQEALQAMITSSNLKYYDGIDNYLKYGYVPAEVNGSSASITLEHAYDDFCIATFAKSIGNDSVADIYFRKAMNYKNLFDPSTGFIRPKYKNGKWKENFDVLATNGQGFIEGNSWNYSFYVPQDVNGLITEMGGDKRFIQRLDSLFTMHLPAKYFEDTEDITEEGMIGNYVHGNEPSQHVPYLYTWTSQPWKSQQWIREIMDTKYLNKVDGLCGNDDCGQMSAWYILSALGFYSVCPGIDQYVLGAPYFEEMTIHWGNEKTFAVKAPGVSAKNKYVKSVILNGKLYNKAYITSTDILNGGELRFIMSSKPNKKRIFNEIQKPYSLTFIK